MWLCSHKTMDKNRWRSPWHSHPCTQKTVLEGPPVETRQIRGGRKIPNSAFISCLTASQKLQRPLSQSSSKKQRKKNASVSFLCEPLWVTSVWQWVFCVWVCAGLKGGEQSILNGAVIRRAGEYINIAFGMYFPFEQSFWTGLLAKALLLAFSL